MVPMKLLRFALIVPERHHIELRRFGLDSQRNHLEETIAFLEDRKDVVFECLDKVGFFLGFDGQFEETSKHISTSVRLDQRARLNPPWNWRAKRFTSGPAARFPRRPPRAWSRPAGRPFSPGLDPRSLRRARAPGKLPTSTAFR